MKTFITLITALLLIGVNPIHAQNSSEPTIFRQAGDYSEEHDVLTIAVKQGTAYKEDYDHFIGRVGEKLDSMSIPYKFFIEHHEDKPGTVFVYFIENSPNGPFNANELAALLPRIERRFKEEYALK